ncbi:hypothetical protein K0U83_02980, partial [bacterium]|nr:hypothetical protein [bacterium]
MANGTLAASQIEMLSQSGTGITTIVPPATNTNRTLTLPDSTGTVATLGTALTLATAVSLSGTAVDFTSIPSWVNRVTVMFDQMSTNGSASKLVQLGTSAGVTTSGYRSGGTWYGGGSSGQATAVTNGMVIYAPNAANITSGPMTLTRMTGNTWTMLVMHCYHDGNGVISGAGIVTLADTLDRVRITTANGTDTF